jgi:hypothetical protein
MRATLFDDERGAVALRRATSRGSPKGSAQTAPSAAVALTASSLANLQRLVGNAVVQKMIAGGLPVQRGKACCSECADGKSCRGDTNLAVQTYGDEPESDSTQNCGPRTVSLPCPGTAVNAVTLKEGEGVAEGIAFVQNVGDCKIGLNGTTGAPSTQLEPAQYLARYTPPPGSTKVRAACWGDCNGTAAVRYDICVGIS